MPHRRNGGGDDGDANAMLRRGLRDLLDKVDRAAAGSNGDASGGRTNGARGGSRGREASRRSNDGRTGPAGRAGAAGGNRPAQEGDWTCGVCHFCPNFARRRTCFKCGRQRSPRAAGRPAAANGPGSLTKGPIGAGGMRPLLGARNEARGATAGASKDADRAPSYRVPGASVAARVGAATACGAPQGGAKGGSSGGTATPPMADVNSRCAAAGSRTRGGTVDDEGFQRVERRNARKGDASTTAGSDDSVGTRQADDDTGRQEGDRDTTATEGDRDDGDAEGTPTTAELQQAWLDEVALVRKLRSQGVQAGHPAMRAACAARDAAEQTWRGSKEPAPASVRLGRAQAKLDRAVELQADARSAILEAEKEHKERMAVLQATMGECTERVRLRRQQLRDVQREVGAGGGGVHDGRQAKAQQAAIRLVHQTICTEVGPTIAALAEQVDTEAPAWTALNSLLGKLSASKAALEGAVGPQGADHFDIGEPHHDEWEGGSEWSESHELGGQAREGGAGGRDDGNDDGHWGQRPGQSSWGDGAVDHDDEFDQSMGTGDWWDGPARRWGEGARWQPSGHGKWRRASWAEQTEDEMRGSDDGDGQPAAARRRLGSAPAEWQGGEARDGGTAAEAHVQRDDPEDSKRRHAQRLDQIIGMAVDAGVTPLSQSGEDLRLLDPHQLDAWVAENLPSALLC